MLTTELIFSLSKANLYFLICLENKIVYFLFKMFD